uniref:Uncharacterized protein n=1 Tax=Arundo donax TaxID=35708 RepID=A0A0A9G6D8_ARUDO
MEETLLILSPYLHSLLYLGACCTDPDVFPPDLS